MGPLLKRQWIITALALASTCSGASAAAEKGNHDDHSIKVGIDIHAFSTSTPLASWVDGGYSKLRFDDTENNSSGNRISVDYTGRLMPTVWARVVADYIDDAIGGADLTEAYLQWRPVPRGPNQHQLRIGAFYPPFSLENSDRAWNSPYTISFSAINTWLGEEVRPIGLEWTLRRRIGGPTSQHRIAYFASAFYGNDAAATLLFWRGWSLHDRQTRFSDRFSLLPYPAVSGGSIEYIPQRVEPIAELDSTPGVYFGAEWTLGRRARVQIAHYDNRADVNAYSHSQWGWYTNFTTLAAQVSLPGEFGFVTQWMGGKTDWISGALADGSIIAPGSIVRDDFDSSFLMLTRPVRGNGRVSIRYDTFSVTRPGSRFAGESDAGDAQTVAYKFRARGPVSIAFEWLRIRSARDLWSNAYGLPRSQTETQIRLQLSLDLEI
jgi:hypothetical protein